MKTVTYHGQPGRALTEDEGGDPVAPDVFRSFDHGTGQTYQVAAGGTVDVTDQAADGLLRDFPDTFTIQADAGPDPAAPPAPAKKGAKTDAGQVAQLQTANAQLEQELAAASQTIAELRKQLAERFVASADPAGQAAAQPVTLEELIKHTRAELDALAAKAGVPDPAGLETKRDVATAILTATTK